MFKPDDNDGETQMLYDVTFLRAGASAAAFGPHFAQSKTDNLSTNAASSLPSQDNDNDFVASQVACHRDRAADSKHN